MPADDWLVVLAALIENHSIVIHKEEEKLASLFWQYNKEGEEEAAAAEKGS